MNNDRAYILADDLELIRQQLDSFHGYDFAEDIAAHMASLGLSNKALGERVGVSHVTVGKWLCGAKPHGKERLKELGMALGMEEGELGRFLQANCYPRLYLKNPLDIACRFVLSQSAGQAHIVRIYREFIHLYGLDAYRPKHVPEDVSTGQLSQAFRDVKTTRSLEQWMRQNADIYRAGDKFYIPHAQLIFFVMLYIGEQSINDLFVAGELPVTIKNMLYPLLAEKEVAIKGLRAKLIVFGLYENMNEDEIDLLLEFARLPWVSEPLTRIDQVILTALRCAHERYPYFERNNAERVLASPRAREIPELLDFYIEQQKRAARFVEYYEQDGHKSELDHLFEENYTDHADCGIIHYMRDIFKLLEMCGALTAQETREYTALMQTYQAAE